MTTKARCPGHEFQMMARFGDGEDSYNISLVNDWLMFLAECLVDGVHGWVVLEALSHVHKLNSRQLVSNQW